MRLFPVRNIARPLWRSTSRKRSFSSSRALRLELVYDLHEPASGPTKNAPIVFLHGLFGSKRNNRTISKVLAKDLNRPVYALTQDLRNHGNSPHATPHTYAALADDVSAFLAKHALAPTTTTIVGHSMGAKTAMTLALRSPELVANVIAVDNAPVSAALGSDFGKYVQGMRLVAERRVTRQKEADEILKAYAPELPIRQFLLTNLAPVGELEGVAYMQWRTPVTTVLARSLDEMADFPFGGQDIEKGVRFRKPALFVRGSESKYVPDEYMPVIGQFFPLFEVADVPGGHWVISENPEGFRKVVVEFLRKQEEDYGGFPTK